MSVVAADVIVAMRMMRARRQPLSACRGHGMPSLLGGGVPLNEGWRAAVSAHEKTAQLHHRQTEGLSPNPYGGGPSTGTVLVSRRRDSSSWRGAEILVNDVGLDELEALRLL
jgi:hypothetical protein